MNNPFRKNRKVALYRYDFWVTLVLLISLVMLGLFPPNDSPSLRKEISSRKRVKELIIKDNYYTKASTQEYRIQLSGHNPDGSVSGTAKVYTEYVDRLIPITIPSGVMEEFYDLLEQANKYLIAGEYQELIFHSEDYPDRRIEVTGDKCTSAAYYSRSQSRDHWGANIGGKNFTTPYHHTVNEYVDWFEVDAPVTVLDAFWVIKKYLQLDSIEPDEEDTAAEQRRRLTDFGLSAESGQDQENYDGELTFGVKVVYE